MTTGPRTVSPRATSRACRASAGHRPGAVCVPARTIAVRVARAPGERPVTARTRVSTASASTAVMAASTWESSSAQPTSPAASSTRASTSRARSRDVAEAGLTRPPAG